MLHVVKLLVQRQHLNIYFKVAMFSYCFVRVNVYILVFVIVVVSRFGRYSLRNVVGSYGKILCRDDEFVCPILCHFSLIS